MNDAPAALNRSTNEGRLLTGVALFLLLLGAGVYANSLANDFVIDDKIVIGGDERVRDGHWWDLLSGEYQLRSAGSGLYRPLTTLSFAANWAVSREAWAFRLPNLLLHVGVAWLLFLLVRAWTGSFPAAIVAAILFVTHPIHTAPLNAVVDRAELGAAFFGLLAVLLWQRDGLEPQKQTWATPFPAAISFTAAVMFKENALTLAAVVVLLDVAGRASQRGAYPGGYWKRRALRCYGPLLLVAVACLAARWAVLGTIAKPPGHIALIDNPIAHPEHDLGPDDSLFLVRWGTPLAVFGKAAGLLVWPRPLSWDYSYDSIPTVRRWSDWRLAAGTAWLLSALLALLFSYRRKRLVFIAVGFALVTYSMVSNTVVVINSLFAERYLYLPSAGVCMLVGVLAGRAIQAIRERVDAGRRLTAGCLLLVVTTMTGWYAWSTVERNRDWRSDRTLNAADLQTNPRSSRLWCAVATDALNAKDFGTAAHFAERSIEICPQYADPWKIAGLAYWQGGELERAAGLIEGFFERSSGADENAVVAAAAIAKARGDYRRAISLLDRLVTLSPRAATPRNNLAWYLLSAEPADLRDAEAALRHAQEAIRLAPGQGDFVDTYIAALLALNHRDDAIRELQRLLPGLRADDPYRVELGRKLADLEQEKGGG